MEIGILKIVKADKDYESYIDALMTEAVPDSAQAISYQSLIENESHSENEITELRVTIPDIENGRFVLCESGNNFGMKYSEDYRFKYIDRSDGNALNLSEKTNQSLEIKKGISQLHTGKMMGLPYKIILFVAGIIMTSLPVTGFIIWYKKVRGKTKSNQKRNKK